MDSSIHHDPFAPDKADLRFSDDSHIDAYQDAVHRADGGGQDPAIAAAQEQSAQELAPPDDHGAGDAAEHLVAHPEPITTATEPQDGTSAAKPSSDAGAARDDGDGDGDQGDDGEA